MHSENINTLIWGRTLTVLLDTHWIMQVYPANLPTLLYQEYFKFLNLLTFRPRASCILGQAFHYSPEKAFYIFNQQIYFIF